MHKIDSLPSFPTFRKLNLQDRRWYDALYKTTPAYADFSFGNLMIWQDQHNDLCASRLGDAVILRCTSLYMENQQMLNFIGGKLPLKTIQTLLDYQKVTHQQELLLGVPQCIIDQVQAEDIAAAQDRDNFEYIINTQQLGLLEGSAMKRMRQSTNGYERDFGPIEIKQLDLKNPQNIQYLRSNLSTWDKAFSTNESAGQERAVIERTLSIAPELDYINVSLLIADELAGFALIQPVPQDGFAIVNHLKTSYKFPHTSYYLIHRVAEVMHHRGVKFINIEQDLGIDGLRAFKEKLKPAYLLEKSNITRV